MSAAAYVPPHRSAEDFKTALSESRAGLVGIPYPCPVHHQNERRGRGQAVASQAPTIRVVRGDGVGMADLVAHRHRRTRI